MVKVKWSRYRPVVAQMMGRGIALLLHDRSTKRGWVVNSTPRPHFTPGKDHIPILQETGWAPGPVWTGGKSRPLRDSIPDRPARSQSLYRLSYPAHVDSNVSINFKRYLLHPRSCYINKVLKYFLPGSQLDSWRPCKNSSIGNHDVNVYDRLYRSEIVSNLQMSKGR